MFILIIAAIIGVLGYVKDFANDSKIYKKRLTTLLLSLFIIFSIVSIIQFKVDEGAREQQSKKAKSDSLINAKKYELDKRKLNGKIDTLVTQTITLNKQLIQSQSLNFKMLEGSVKASVDTINNYVTGSGGYCYIVPTKLENGMYTGAIVNPFHYAMHHAAFEIIQNDSLKLVRRHYEGKDLVYNWDDLMKRVIPVPGIEIIMHGRTELQPFKFPPSNSRYQKFKIAIMLLNRSFDENLIVYAPVNGKSNYAIQLYSYSTDKHRSELIFHEGYNTKDIHLWDDFDLPLISATYDYR